MHLDSNPVSRRDALQRMGASAGLLLAMGLWPGTLRADNARPSARFKFIVVNDTHHLTDECSVYLTAAVQQMRQSSPALCLHCGDLTDKGEAANFEKVDAVLKKLGVPYHVVIGNHDYLTQTDRTGYLKVFPKSINYRFRYRGWQFVALDTTDGQKYQGTAIAEETLRWVDDQLPRLDPRRPTVIFTHFPMGPGVNYRPSNADALLYRFRDFNLQAVFCGHYHSLTERISGGAFITTNRCCSLQRGNHDGSKEKGYFVCEAADGRLNHTFVEFVTPSTSSKTKAG